jgi:uncharacterized repeat protein (TIGR02543 family)
MLTYTMEYYLQDLNGNTYTKHTVTTNGSAEINTVLAFGKSDAISINGFTFIENAAENVLSATLTQDGFVFKFYYSRNKYTLTVDFGGEQIKAMKEVNYERVLSNRNEEYGQQSFTVPYGADIASYLPAMTFTDIGYKFTGWSQSSGTMPAGNLTVKAQWTPVQVTVVFSPGASYLFPSGYDSAANTVRKTYDYGSKISWPADVVIRNEGYVIAGWSFGTQQGSYPVLEFPVYLVEGYVDTHMTFTGTTGGLELTVCPYWVSTSSAVTVVFDANGGKGTMDSIYVDAHSYRELPQMGFTRSGYRFTGWNTAADGSGTSHDTTFYPDYGSGGTTVTLYAQWEAA